MEPPPPQPAGKSLAQQKYKPPSWSAQPQFECALEVIKRGIVIETIDVSKKPFYTIGNKGRAAATTYTTAHPLLTRNNNIHTNAACQVETLHATFQCSMLQSRVSMLLSNTTKTVGSCACASLHPHKAHTHLAHLT